MPTPRYPIRYTLPGAPFPRAGPQPIGTSVGNDWRESSRCENGTVGSGALS